MKRVNLVLFAVILITLMLSCKPTTGYGVVLWSANEVEIATGMVVALASYSPRKNIYRIETPLGLVELDAWRVQTFKTQKAAQEFANNYARYMRTYVEAVRALPMREEARADSLRIYQVREGQVMKVLGRSSERVQVGTYKAYWYYVLTTDGAMGWVYGRFLQAYTVADTGQVVHDERGYTGDAVLEDFFWEGVIWRPEYFKTMMDRNEVDLTAISDAYGLFIDPLKKTIKIMLPAHTAEFTYTRITPVGGNAYMFVDSPFSFTLSSGLTKARYQYQGVNYHEGFVPLDTSVADIIGKERMRRSALHKKFVDLGPSFLSDGATITFTRDGGFLLTDAQRMVNYFGLQESDGQAGKVLFDLFLTGEVKDRYDGGFTLVFEQSGRTISFVYRMAHNGFSLVFVERMVNDNLVSNLAFLDTRLTLEFKN
jgi:hypothetical protein